MIVWSRIGRIILLTALACSSGHAAAPEGSAYKLQLTLNGHRVLGLQESLAAAKLTDKTITLSVASHNKLSVIAISPDGRSRDVTNSPALRVLAPGSQIIYSDGNVDVPPSASEGGTSGLITMFVIYAPEGNNKPYGMNELHLKIIGGALTGALRGSASDKAGD